jgi:hypothetical protein
MLQRQRSIRGFPDVELDDDLLLLCDAKYWEKVEAALTEPRGSLEFAE